MPTSSHNPGAKDPISFADLRHVITWQRFEGAAMLAFFSFKFFSLGVAWFWYPLLILSFDISMIGYLFGRQVGAFFYNLGHTSIIALVLLTIGHFYPDILYLQAIGFLWLAHIGLDRAFGFGLKMKRGFRHTHLGIIAEVMEHPLQPPEADAHAVLVPAPVGVVGQHGLALRRGDHHARHRPAHVPLLERQQRPHDEP